MNFTLYPIYRLADEVSGEPFDLGRLPFDITEDVRIEAVKERFRIGTFNPHKVRLGTSVVEEMEQVRFALVHRYKPKPIIVDNEIIGEQGSNEDSEKLVRMLAACLRLIRPMRQNALLMHGRIRAEDDSFDVTGFDIPPLRLIEVPDVQKFFHLRNQDADELRTYAPGFLHAMRGQFWKFRMAVQFYELGHFQALDWKARYLQWCSAIESIYTSHSREHQGSLVATSRIKWFLGAGTYIYAPGDISDLLPDPKIRIDQIVDDLYEMRNFMAHGDKIPDPFFTTTLRIGFNGPVQKREVLLEAASFIVRASLLKILRDGLIDHFADAGPAELYFGAEHLTKSELYAARDAARKAASWSAESWIRARTLRTCYRTRESPVPSYAKREHSEETSGAGRETGGLLAGARRLGDLAGLADWVRWRTGMPREEAIWDKLVGARGQGVGVSRRPESTGRRWLAGRLTRVWCDLARLICPGVCGGLEICAGTPAVPSTYRTSVNRQISGGNFMVDKRLGVC